jgi:hypothetical protein
VVVGATVVVVVVVAVVVVGATVVVVVGATVVVVVGATVVVVVVVGTTVGTVSLLGGTPPKLSQFDPAGTHLSVFPIVLSTINTGESAVSPKLNTAKPSLYVPVTETSYVDVCHPVAP